MADCIHYWKLGAPADGVTRGTCARCGEEREWAEARWALNPADRRPASWRVIKKEETKLDQPSTTQELLEAAKAMERVLTEERERLAVRMTAIDGELATLRAAIPALRGQPTPEEPKKRKSRKGYTLNLTPEQRAARANNFHGRNGAQSELVVPEV